MTPEETLRMVREAFRQVGRDGDLKGWGLDERIGSPFCQEPHATELTVSLRRGDAEQAAVRIDPALVARREGALTASGLAEEISRALRARGILPG